MPRIWVTEKGKNTLKERLKELRKNAISINRNLQMDDLGTKRSLIDIMKRFDIMDNKVHDLHHTVDRFSFTWRRRGKKVPIPSTGSLVPLGLMIPVIVDCMVDGLLMGTSLAVSTRAGAILGVSNGIEMAFLGLAVSVRVQKCTGSSVFVRYACLIAPPLMMLGAALLGAYIGLAARSHAITFVSFISFGIVALLYLVVNELLVEAREAMNEKDTWLASTILFLGVYCVVVVDLILP